MVLKKITCFKELFHIKTFILNLRTNTWKRGILAIPIK